MPKCGCKASVKEVGVSGEQQNSPITYRPFTADDLVAAHALSRAAKWRHRPDDWRFVAATGQGFVAEQAGVVIATTLRWMYGDGGAALGMLIVAPEHQGRGIGHKLIELQLKETGDRTTVMQASPLGRPICEQLGFTAAGTLDQHQGAAFQPPLVSLPPGERLRPIGSNDTPRLVELATRASGLDRSAILPAVLEAADGIALDRDGEMLGFALFRRFGDGHVIGPVIAPEAPDCSRAKALISHWLALNAGMFVRIDTPEDSGLSAWLEEMGLPLVDTITTMVRNGPLRVDPDVRQFAVTSQAVY
jgi:GNAT superfamily N-acetyltransferase